MNTKNSSAVVTGASTGIGRALAVCLAGNGWHIALLARNKKALLETATLVKNAGGVPYIFQVDLRDTKAILDTSAKITSSLPSLNLIANIAGVWHDEEKAFQGPLLHETTNEQVLEVIHVGMQAPIILTSSLLPRMIKEGHGNILNVSGTFYSGAKGWLHYYIAKKAVEAFTVGLAQELRQFEIQVNCICPADVATDAYKRFYPQYAANALKPEEVAAFMLSMLSPVNQHITGQVLEIRNRHDHG